MANPLMTAKAFEAKGLEVGQELEKMYIIPEDEIQPVALYYAGLMRNSPDMKVHRIVRKTVEFFKLKKRE